jgi:hypothetical protein
VENRYRPSICDSGGEEKFRQGPGLAFPRRSQRTEKNGDLTSEVNAFGRHGDVTFDVSLKRRRSSRPLQSTRIEHT